MTAQSTTYPAIHQRLRRERGSASAHPCAAPACARQARNWAWQRTGPSLTGEHSGERVTWGTDLDTYAPMCPSHAAMLDRGGTLTHCPSGHERAAVGVHVSGCAECNRAKNRRYRDDPTYREREREDRRRRRASAGT